MRLLLLLLISTLPLWAQANIYYVQTNGADETAVVGEANHSFASPVMAVDAANAALTDGETNCVIALGAGTFDIGYNSLWPEHPMTIQGKGQGVTRILFCGNEHLQGPAIMLANGVTVKDVEITGYFNTVVHLNNKWNLLAGGRDYTAGQVLSIQGGDTNEAIRVETVDLQGSIQIFSEIDTGHLYQTNLAYPTLDFSSHPHGSNATFSLIPNPTTNLDVIDQTCVGALSDSPNANFCGTSRVDHCTLTAGAHGVQLNPTNPNPARVIFRGCTFHSPNSPGQVLIPNGTLEIHDFYADSTGPELKGRGYSCGFQNFGGTLILHNGTIHVGEFDRDGYRAYGVATQMDGSDIAGGITNDIRNVLFDLPQHSSNTVVAEMAFNAQATTTYLGGCRRLNGEPLRLTTASGTFIIPAAPAKHEFPTNQITTIFTTNVTLAFPAISAGGSADIVISLSGVSTNEPWRCLVEPNDPVRASGTNVTFEAKVSALNTLTIQARNGNASHDQPPVNGSFLIFAMKVFL